MEPGREDRQKLKSRGLVNYNMSRRPGNCAYYRLAEARILAALEGVTGVLYISNQEAEATFRNCKGLDGESVLFDTSDYRKRVNKQPNFLSGGSRKSQFLKSRCNRREVQLDDTLVASTS